MRLIRNYVYFHFTFPTNNEGGSGIRAGGLGNFSKILISGGDDYLVLESNSLSVWSNLLVTTNMYKDQSKEEWKELLQCSLEQ